MYHLLIHGQNFIHHLKRLNYKKTSPVPIFSIPKPPPSIFSFFSQQWLTKRSLLFLSFSMSCLGTFAGRDIPKKGSNKLQPNLYIDHDGGVLVPGIGRFLVPKKKNHHKLGFNPFTYNPITGKNGGNGLGIPTIPTTPTDGIGTPSYIPGGDDTGIPNPGFEVPTGATPSPPARR